ncbi:MAG: amidohydrolase family protein [Acidimicrobiia bacterium]
MADLILVDGDGHTMEPDDLWTNRMDRDRWGDWIPYKVLEDEVYETTYTAGVVRGGGRELVDQICAKVGLTPREFRNLLESLRVPGGYDPDARVADMDRDGIDAAVVYPSMALFFGPVDPIEGLRDVEFVADCQRAYNDWAAEFCRAHPTRLFAMAAVPLQDIDRAVAETERAVDRLGLQGVFVRPSPYIDELPLNNPVYDRFWAACQDLEVPVAFHPGVHIDTPGACKKFGLVLDDPNIMATNSAVDELHGGSGLGQAVGNTVDMIVTMGRLLMGGVCERFPRLRLLFLEAGGGWIPTQLERMDEQVKAFPLERRWLTLLPSEYFRRQCWAGFEAEEWNLAACADFLGADRILWASDYPHPEFHPGVVKEMLERISSLPDEDQRRIAGQNAIDAYNLPL